MRPLSFTSALEHTYARDIPGGSAPAAPQAAPQPRLLWFNRDLAQELGLPTDGVSDDDLAQCFSGNALPTGSQPVAQAYAGHQFGRFSPQLGDGRALLLGELRAPDGSLCDLALKGSGRTPFSRGGDGLAAVGPMLREALMGESLHALGVPTTRALAVVATGGTVRRDTALPGAVLCRVAASHIRVGTFEYFAAREDTAALQALLAHTVARHDPTLAALPAEEQALALLQAVVRRQAHLIAQWMDIGLIHGVMNTDNMTLSGETIDFGPCAMLEAHDPAAVFSSIDLGGRYAYGNQPRIAAWNLARLAEALLPLMVPPSADPAAAIPAATEAVQAFASHYGAARLALARSRWGLDAPGPADAALDAGDNRLLDDWLALLHAHRVDHTLAGWHLAGAWPGAGMGAGMGANTGASGGLHALFGAEAQAPLNAWLARWQQRLAQAGPGTMPAAQARARLRQHSPWIIARNHRVEEALAAATAGDLAPFDALMAALRQPFSPDGQDARRAPYAEAAAPDITAGYQTFCGT
ncbi:protein adenylyltransferase SelO [Amphibiibacter pelophylacis]|uniref:YdiU family protein n=1 Tax=Amphibiibacter pelophylacis TaxID=1799477 RepID=A0ACC6P0X5_9BURK